METKAPDRFDLLATPVSFTVDSNGVVLDPNQAAANGTLIGLSADKLMITVTDTQTGDLPEAGGLGPGPNLGIGLFLVAGAILLYWRTSRNRPAQNLAARD